MTTKPYRHPPPFQGCPPRQSASSGSSTCTVARQPTQMSTRCPSTREIYTPVSSPLAGACIHSPLLPDNTLFRSRAQTPAQTSARQPVPDTPSTTQSPCRVLRVTGGSVSTRPFNSNTCCRSGSCSIGTDWKSHSQLHGCATVDSPSDVGRHMIRLQGTVRLRISQHLHRVL